MGRQLTIRSGAACRLAAERAAPKGDGLTGAVAASLRARPAAGRDMRAARSEALTSDIPGRLKPGTTSAGHDGLRRPGGLPT